MDIDGAVDLRGARVLITGGAGLVGSTIADQLVAYRPQEIVVLDDLSRGRATNLSGAIAKGPLRVIEGDVRDAATVEAAVAGVDVVFHEAAIRITQCAEEPRLAFEVLGLGTFNVIEAAAAADVRKIVAASSASVYGQADELPTSEDHHPWHDQTLYGAAKVFGEGMLRSFQQMFGLDYVALRYFNVYGPRMDIHGVYTEVLIRWMERIEAGLRPLILGDGSQTMDFVNVADVARANILAATLPVRNDVFNIGSGTSTSLLELAWWLLSVMGSDLRPEFGPERQTNAVRHRRADVRKAAVRLGFRTEIDLPTGLEDLVEWWRAEQGVARAYERVTG